jgi:hypothetical protein
MILLLGLDRISMLIFTVVAGRPSQIWVSPTMANTSRSQAQGFTSILCALLLFHFFLLFLGLIPSHHHFVGAVCDRNRCAAASGTYVEPARQLERQRGIPQIM